MSAARTEVRKASVDFNDFQEKQRDNGVKEQDATEAAARITILALALVGLGLGVTVALLFSRSISNGVVRMVDMIQEVANNNLSVQDLEVTSEDEIGRASRALTEWGIA